MLVPINGEEETLLAERNIHANANRIIQGLQSAYEILNHDEGAISKIGNANANLAKIEALGSELVKSIIQRLKQIS